MPVQVDALLGGGGGGAKVCCPPPLSNYWGAGLPGPPLPTPISRCCLKFMEGNARFFRICISFSNKFIFCFLFVLWYVQIDALYVFRMALLLFYSCTIPLDWAKKENQIICENDL